MMKYIAHEKLKKMKRDISYWEMWFDTRYTERHFCLKHEHCECLELYDAAILKTDKDDKGVQRWKLLKVWLADKEEVADGEADEIGDVMSASGMAIHYCPMCGLKLV
jgi:hypothetical protein